MKIAYVYDAVYPYVKGGIEKRVWELGKRLAGEHEVHLYGMKYWSGPSTIVKNGVYLHGVCEPLGLYVNGRRSVKEALYFSFRVLSLLREDFDVIDCQQMPYLHCFSARLSSLIRQNPLVITWYEVWASHWYEYLGAKGILGRIAENAAVRLPRLIIAISERVGDDLVTLGVQARRLKCVPNGVDFQRTMQIEPSTEESDVIYVGRLISHKNVDLLLRALLIVREEFRDLSCVIIGGGPQAEELRTLCGSLGLHDNVRFLGVLEEDESVLARMKASKIFVLPSTREGFPSTILEANACGLPAIIVRHPQNAAVGVVKDGSSGYIAEPSPDQVAKKILYLLEKGDKLANMKTHALEFAKQHDWALIVQRIQEAYGDLVE